MNNNRRTVILFMAAFLVLISFLFPPIQGFAMIGGGHWGYRFLFAIPRNATVNVALLLTEWVGVLLFWGLVYLALKD